MNSKKVGNLGENIAVEFLEKKGYKILDRNYYCPFGEIDIIVRKENIIVFVEVKVVNGVGLEALEELVNKKKRVKIINSAKHYLDKKNIENFIIRFDVVAVFTDKTVVRHFEDAFME